ncbi:hypothetical protein EW146_g3679 [Bondarzewia mesenterica]|uniref:NADP-dependent oxidoreductase domain-containing protein n=1 Tax=Bondarzewia mesenterica TaxID=1095465 RepID=A0A4S4LX28_9AGAM|nr:hypothetical protein EW146_g3679 [Bondarzewia mesenterica]
MSDGNEIPRLGFGTYELDGKDAYQAVTWALEDTATWYENEAECGQAIRDFCARTGTPRSEIFYTTKLRENAGFAATVKAIQFSLDACGLDYIDLYLIHGPEGGPQKRKEAWEAILQAQKEGKLRTVGVSTYGIKHLKELIDGGMQVPTVHQIDLHPFMTRTEIVKYCKDHDIALEAWSSLARGMRMSHPSIVALTKKYNKEPAHIFLRYSLQKGYVPLVKSSSKERVISNTKVYDFALTDEEIAHLDSLNENLRVDWDPTDCP